MQSDKSFITSESEALGTTILIDEFMSMGKYK